MTKTKPILYSFRRCPYAMRARLAVMASGQRVHLREVVLRNKPSEMLAASPKATVPVLVLPDGKVIDESLDIAYWALRKSDPLCLLDEQSEHYGEMKALIKTFDGSFKKHLDRYKYGNRYPGENPVDHAQAASVHLNRLDDRLADQDFLFGNKLRFADMMILPFVRQFAGVDRDWFYSQDWAHVIRWLNDFLGSELYKSVMEKYAPWQVGDKPVRFGGSRPSSNTSTQPEAQVG